jgi:hypothetical protein
MSLAKAYQSIDRMAIPEPMSGCHLWMGAMHAGYPQVCLKKSVNKSAALVNYERHFGVLPKGFIVRTTCGIRLCVNPFHMIPVEWKQEQRRNGRKVGGLPKTIIGVLERIAPMIIPEPMSGCWLWTGAVDQHNYPQCRVLSDVPKGKTKRVANIIYESVRGVIPTGMVLRHKCDTPLCVNPDHLETGTQMDNIHDMIKRGRGHWQKKGVVK